MCEEALQNGRATTSAHRKFGKVNLKYNPLSESHAFSFTILFELKRGPGGCKMSAGLGFCLPDAGIKGSEHTWKSHVQDGWEILATQEGTETLMKVRK